MFGLVSKKKYRELEEKYRELSTELSSKRWERITELQGATAQQTMTTFILEQNRRLDKELQKYKQKFVDELQKRIELEEMVKALEEGVGGNGEGKVDSAAGTAEG